MADTIPQHHEYSDFLQRYQQNPDSISAEEALQQYQALTDRAPAELATEADKHAFDQLSAESRQALAQRYQQAHDDPANAFDGFAFTNHAQAAEPQHLGQMTRQMGQQAPDLLGQVMNSPIARSVLAAGAAYVASRIFGGQGRANQVPLPAAPAAPPPPVATAGVPDPRAQGSHRR